MKNLKLLLTIAILFAAEIALAQDYVPVNYDLISSEISKKNSPFYYQNLYDRYLAGDTSLTSTECRYVYFGFTTRPEYKPYGRYGKMSEINAILNKEELEKADYESLLSLSKEGLDEFPFDIKLLNYAGWAASKLGDENLKTQFYFRADCIYEAILGSSDGATTESAFYVIDIAHEYALLSAFDFEFGGQQSLLGQVDRLTIAENEYEIEEMFFNVSASLNHLTKSFGSDKKSTKKEKKKKKKK
jgi:hypothetical protein